RGDVPGFRVQVLEVRVPREGHEDVRDHQEEDGAQDDRHLRLPDHAEMGAQYSEASVPVLPSTLLLSTFSPMDLEFDTAVAELARVGSAFHAGGWVLGTSGNLSTVLRRDPLLLAITASGVDKGELRAEQFLAIDAAGRIERSENGNRPSDEHALHLELV